MGASGRALVRVALALFAAFAMLTAGASAAAAHAYLASSTPAQGSVPKASPALVTLHFSEPVGTSLATISVLDATGGNVAAGPVIQPFNVRSDLAVPLSPALPDGTYVVVWRVVSEDSHPSAGSFSFSVGQAGGSAGGAAAVVAVPDQKVGALLGFSRLLGFIGVAAFLGGAAFLLLCWPAGKAAPASRRTLQVGWLLAFGGATAALVLQGPYGAGTSLRHALDWSLIRGVAHSRYGHALLARVLLLVLAAVCTTVLRPARRWGPWMFGLLAVATLVTFPYTGHPSVGSDVPLAVLSDVLHLAAMCLWFGGLLQLSVVVLPEQDDATALAAAARFSRLAMASVAVLVGTGVYQAWREAGIAGSLTTTRYGQLLLFKTALVVVVLLVAEASRRWVGRAGRGDEAPTVRRLGLSVSLETGLVVVVLAVTSLLVAGVPARRDYRPSSEQNVLAGPVHLQLAVNPSASRVLDLRVDSTDAAGRPMELDELTLRMRPAKGAVVPLIIRLAAIGGTQFQATDVELPSTGQWDLTLAARTSETKEYAGTATLEVR